jgi:hypothetical protein
MIGRLGGSGKAASLKPLSEPQPPLVVPPPPPNPKCVHTKYKAVRCPPLIGPFLLTVSRLYNIAACYYVIVMDGHHHPASFRVRWVCKDDADKAKKKIRQRMSYTMRDHGEATFISKGMYIEIHSMRISIIFVLGKKIIFLQLMCIYCRFWYYTVYMECCAA